MDITPYPIAYWHGDVLSSAEIRPCCLENNVVDYAVYINDQLSFTITKSKAGDERWIISLKNADEDIDDEIIQNIGREIDRHND